VWWHFCVPGTQHKAWHTISLHKADWEGHWCRILNEVGSQESLVTTRAGEEGELKTTRFCPYVLGEQKSGDICCKKIQGEEEQ
jgi:hypothetical protein